MTEPDEADDDAPLSIDDVIDAGIAELGVGEEPEPVEDELPQVEDEPLALSPEDRKFIDSLPLGMRETARSWRAEIKRGAQERFDAAAAARKDVEDLDAALSPMAQGMQAQGVSRVAAVKQLVEGMQQIQRDPAAGLIALAGAVGTRRPDPGHAAELVRQVAAHLGINVGTLGHAAGTPGQASSVEAGRIAALEAKLAGYERAQAQAAQSQHDLAVSEADTAIRNFAAAKDAAGRLLHPHFDAVRREVGALMTATGADLETAYSRAVWARDDLRDGLITAKQAAAAKAAAELRRAGVSKAKGAATPRTANIGVGADKMPELIDALIERGMRELRV